MSSATITPLTAIVTTSEITDAALDSHLYRRTHDEHRRVAAAGLDPTPEGIYQNVKTYGLEATISPSAQPDDELRIVNLPPPFSTT